ncbi:MAG: hypothetical protein NVSMB25_12450 [Thermoleophilaceae bacterium]
MLSLLVGSEVAQAARFLLLFLPGEYLNLSGDPSAPRGLQVTADPTGAAEGRFDFGGQKVEVGLVRIDPERPTRYTWRTCNGGCARAIWS